MLKKIIDDTKKTGKFNFEKIIENNKLTDDDFFEFIKFIHIENIPEIRNSVDGKDFIVLEDENYYMEEKETIKAYLEDIKEKYKVSNKENNNKKEELFNEINNSTYLFFAIDFMTKVDNNIFDFFQNFDQF